MYNHTEAWKGHAEIPSFEFVYLYKVLVHDIFFDDLIW